MNQSNCAEASAQPPKASAIGRQTTVLPREIAVKAAAERLGCTVQRLNQLAALGVVCKTRHGHLDWPETERRVRAWREEVAWSRARLVKCERPPEYWVAQGRNVDLLGGALESELAELTEIIEALKSTMAAHAAAGVSPSPFAMNMEARAQRHSIFEEVERLAATLAKVRERGLHQRAYMEKHGASAVDSLRPAR